MFNNFNKSLTRHFSRGLIFWQTRKYERGSFCPMSCNRRSPVHVKKQGGADHAHRGHRHCPASNPGGPLEMSGWEEGPAAKGMHMKLYTKAHI